MPIIRNNLAVVISPPTGGSDLRLDINISRPVRKGTAIVGSLVARGGTGPYAYSLTGAPGWLSIDSTTGVLAGTPSAQGHVQFLAQVQDSATPTPAVFTCTVTIDVLSPLYIVAADLPPAEEGVDYHYNLSVSGNTGPLRWTVGAGASPSGILVGGQGVDAGTQIVTTLTGAVTTYIGSFYKIPVTDASGFAINEWLSIYDVGPVNLFFGKVANIVGNDVYVTIADAIVISGSPTAITSGFCQSEIGGLVYNVPAAGSAGLYSFIVRATDTTTGDYIDIPLNMSVAANPVVTFNDLTGSDLPPARIGVPYSATVTVTGGVAPFQYFDTNGQLASLGLSVSPSTGSVSGTITDATIADGSPYLAEVDVIDALGQTGLTAQAALTVKPATTSFSSDFSVSVVDGVANVALASSPGGGGASGFSPWQVAGPSGEEGERGADGISQWGNSTAAVADSVGAQWESSVSITVSAAKPIDRYVPFSCIIRSVTLLAYGGTGSCVVDIKKGTYAGFPPTASICGAALPTISSGTKYQDTTLTGWTTTVNAGDVLRFVLNSSSAFNRISIILGVTPL